MTARNAKQRSRMHTREARQKAEAAALLAQGLNPYEVFRKRAKDARQARATAEGQRRLRERENALAQQMFYEEELYQREREAARVEQSYVDRFNAEMGKGAKEARTTKFMLSHTRQKTDLLDPAGLAPVYPSQAAVVKKNMGTGHAEPILIAKLQAKYHEVPDPLLFPGVSQRFGGDAPPLTPGRDDVFAPSPGGPPLTPGRFDASQQAPPSKRVVDLAKPEFPGLWEQATRKKGLAEDGGSDGGSEDGRAALDSPEQQRAKKTVRSKLEQDMLRTAREKQRANITKTQVVCRREFKGQAFLPSPSQILFKDFEVGTRYKRRVTLTNVSFSFNSFKGAPPSGCVSGVARVGEFLLPGLATEPSPPPFPSPPSPPQCWSCPTSSRTSSPWPTPSPARSPRA